MSFGPALYSLRSPSPSVSALRVTIAIAGVLLLAGCDDPRKMAPEQVAVEAQRCRDLGLVPSIATTIAGEVIHVNCWPREVKP